MNTSFYEKAGEQISPSDIFESLPYIRLPKPLRITRKLPVGLPPKIAQKVQGEVREILDPLKHSAVPPFDFGQQGEEAISRAKISKIIFLTAGCEVDSDLVMGNLHSKDWMGAPMFPLRPLEGRHVRDDVTGENVDLARAIREGRSPRYFPLTAFPEDNEEYFVDFRKICPLAASFFTELPRRWRLAPPALNGFYGQLLWFFTRKRIFFAATNCPNCGHSVSWDAPLDGQAFDADR